MRPTPLLNAIIAPSPRVGDEVPSEAIGDAEHRSGGPVSHLGVLVPGKTSTPRSGIRAADSGGSRTLLRAISDLHGFTTVFHRATGTARGRATRGDRLCGPTGLSIWRGDSIPGRKEIAMHPGPRR